jgi:hypothetical protein
MFTDVSNANITILHVLSCGALPVCFLMDSKQSLAYKFLITYVTFVGSLSCVEALVNGQSGALGKCFPTYTTFVGPFSSVSALMLFEVPALYESLPTYITSK